MSEEIREAVRRGAALLDEREPGWRDRISPGELDLADCYECVLGQLFGSYLTGVHLLEVPGYVYGFSAQGWEYPALNEAWIGYLKGHWS